MNAPEALFPSSWTKGKKQPELLKLAKSILLEPTGLTEQDLHRTFSNMFTHRLDDADLYFQHTRNESWSLEEGIVKSGSFSIDQGVGVQAIYVDKTAFAYSDKMNLEALIKQQKQRGSLGHKVANRRSAVKFLFRLLMSSTLISTP